MVESIGPKVLPRLEKHQIWMQKYREVANRSMFAVHLQRTRTNAYWAKVHSDEIT